MYINFDSFRKRAEVGGDSVSSYPVQSKETGHVGYIHFITDKNGIGYLEWCKGSTAEGYGEKISLADLFDLLERRSKSD